jgi:hypothetical protein
MNGAAGVVAARALSGMAHLAAQAIDIAVASNRADARMLVGALEPVDRNGAVAIGPVIHLVNSLAFAAAFRLAGRDVLAGPMWLRGVTFALIETAAVYPTAIFERSHPAIRDGSLPSYRTLVAFAQQGWRHGGLGATLGPLTPKTRQQSPGQRRRALSNFRSTVPTIRRKPMSIG